MDIKTYLPDNVLRKVDIASMSLGLEVRTPIVDRDVYELAARIPDNYHFDLVDGKREGKSILRHLMRRKFHGEIVDRKKSGFAMPLESWGRGKSGVLSVSGERFGDPGSPLYEYFIKDQVLATRSQGKMKSTWLLLVLDEWLRQQADLRRCDDGARVANVR